MNMSQETERKIDAIISELTLEEKVAMCHGNSSFTSAGAERLGISELTMDDGPHGVRAEIEKNGWRSLNRPEDACTYLPTGTALAATWNPCLAKRFGETLGSEARYRQKDIILGPGINIIRNPLCGRNFEYMSEDPCLVEKMVPELVKGIESQDVSSCVKHFAVNNQELDRLKMNVEVGKRALHEIYLRGFKAAVSAGASSIMGAYNQYQNQHCCHNSYLINDVLKGRWGFKGLVVSDWGGTHSTDEAIVNGLDIEMGSGDSYDNYYLANAFLKKAEESEEVRKCLDDKIRRILRLMFSVKHNSPDRKKGEFNTKEHQQTTYDIAAEAMVLLKNEGGILPLDKSKLKKILVAGPNADVKHAAKGGSSEVMALYEITPLEGIKNRFDSVCEVKYDDGENEREFLKKAAEADYVIYVGGINHDYDAEGNDKKTMALPAEQDSVIPKLLKANSNTIISVVAGSPVEMPWINEAKAVIWNWYSGMETGNVFADILAGDICPSGKMPFTLPYKYIDTPVARYGEYKEGNCKYNEDILVGYRGYDYDNIAPMFPFGHGLSYSKFEYSDLTVETKGTEAAVSFRVKNTGNITAKETAQLYIGDPVCNVKRPVKELRNFKKVLLNPGEDAIITFDITEADLSFFDEATEEWVLEKGEFTVFVGASSRDIKLDGNFVIE